MNEEHKANYYAMIPAYIRYNNQLKFAERLMYGEITALSNKEGYCFASNRYFANLYGVSQSTISRWISHLAELNSIKVEVIRNEKKEIIERRIYLTDTPYVQNCVYPYMQKNQQPIRKMSKDNIININMLDSVCGSIFRNNGIKDEYVLELVDTKSGDIIASTGNRALGIEKKLVSNMVELGLKSHHGVIVYFDTPYRTFFTQMTGALISSFLLLVLLVVCFIYQIKTILVQYQISKIREEFMSSMVHELKLPLSAVQNAFSGIISYGTENLKDAQRILLNAAHKRVDQLNNFVYKLLIVWKQGFKISWNRLNLRETIDSLVALFDPMLMGKNVSIKVDYQLSVDVIEADDIHFPNAISNLIENAIKYSGDPAKIEIECKEVDGMVVIAIKDNGIGIPEKLKEKIFERYYRIHRGRSTDVHGFGIGLSYVKQVIEAHEGVIRVESEVGVGTTFTVMIPLVKDEND